MPSRAARLLGLTAAAVAAGAAALWALAPPRAGDDLPGWDRGGPGARGAATGSLTILAYNLEGLPPPARWGRAGQLRMIADQLAAMRRVGEAPQIVLLQEAFIDPGPTIEEIAGYRYVVQGPRQPNTARPATAAERAFAAQALRTKGEGAGKWIGSGLRILSDYPIVAVRKLAFPAWMCAGFDCLANKGVLLAWIAVPGSPRPVPVIDTHLQSMRLAGVPGARSGEAYAMQVRAMKAFVAANVPAESAVFFGGDFDTEDEARRALFTEPPLAGARNALEDALAHPNTIAASDRANLLAVVAHGVDRLYYRGASGWPVALERFATPFGPRDDGTMLSDHIGYTARFAVGPQRAS
jgi:endonuclease/exonuclease/phosphatase family metal-dependent hydrolase